MKEKLIHLLLRNKMFTHLFFASITTVTLLLTLLPPHRLEAPQLFQYDKIGHFSLFLMWTLSFGLLLISRNPTKANTFLVVITGVLFGVILEFFQFLLPFERYFEVYDAFANILGSLSAGWIILILKKKYNELVS